MKLPDRRRETATRFAVVVLVIALVTVVSVLMHVMFTEGPSPLTVEILAAVLAVVLVVASVGVTIHFQAKSETEREFRVKLFEEKLKIYVGLLNCITAADDDVTIDSAEMNEIRNRARVAALVASEPLLSSLAPFLEKVINQGRLPDPSGTHTFSMVVQAMRDDLGVVDDEKRRCSRGHQTNDAGGASHKLMWRLLAIIEHMPPKTTEVAFNAHLAEVLRTKHPLWANLLAAEQTKVVAENPSLRPDILVRSRTSQPVALETEFRPAATVENDAVSRLGLTLKDTGETIEQTIALRIPVDLQSGQAGLPLRIAEATFEYCLYSRRTQGATRWPHEGWLHGGVDELARCIEYASYSERLIAEYSDIFTRGVATAAHRLSLDGESFPDAQKTIGEVLNQAPGEQTDRMAMAIVGNALMFPCDRRRCPRHSDHRRTTAQERRETEQVQGAPMLGPHSE